MVLIISRVYDQRVRSVYSATFRGRETRCSCKRTVVQQCSLAELQCSHNGVFGRRTRPLELVSMYPLIAFNLTHYTQAYIACQTVAGQYLLLRHEIIPTDDPAVSDITNTSFASQSEPWSNWIRYYNNVILILGTANYTAGPSSFLLQYPTVSQLIGNPYRTILKAEFCLILGT